MNSKVTIVMYHYVRDLKNSRYPNIKGLETINFEKQIEYLTTNYDIITMEEFIYAIEKKTKLPNNALLLTFDDGYIDHFTHVLPVLLKFNLQGTFFIPAGIRNENNILDVNKIHFILEKCNDIEILKADIFNLININRSQYHLEPFEYYYNKLAIANRFDTADVIFVKRILQAELNIELRKVILDKLFIKYVSVPENVFSNELYLNINQIKAMVKCGMFVGAHGYNHFWHSKIDQNQQKIEIEKSINFLNEIGVDPIYRTYCYPYGSYNNVTIDLLKKFNFKCAFTTIPKIADVKLFGNFELPRFDTNDLPFC
jgi:peptidoglycan/xylan/chitin deacetylase (PgdA/CDA1 family)